MLIKADHDTAIGQTSGHRCSRLLDLILIGASSIDLLDVPVVLDLLHLLDLLRSW
jgi:hypothetical protein